MPFMPLLYKNTDSSDRSHDSLSFSKSIFSYESSNSFSQWAYLISPNPSSAVAYSCPHTKPNKTNFLFCVLIYVLKPTFSFDKRSKSRSRVYHQVLFFFFPCFLLEIDSKLFKHYKSLIVEIRPIAPKLNG